MKQLTEADFEDHIEGANVVVKFKPTGSTVRFMLPVSEDTLLPSGELSPSYQLQHPSGGFGPYVESEVTRLAFTIAQKRAEAWKPK